MLPTDTAYYVFPNSRSFGTLCALDADCDRPPPAAAAAGCRLEDANVAYETLVEELAIDGVYPLLILDPE